MFSCKKPVQYSEIPKIEFESFIVKDTVTALNEGKVGVLTMAFVDGNGDLGLTPADTLPPFDRESEFYYNIFVDMYEMSDSGFVLVEDLETPLNYRFKKLDDETSQNKTLKGKIKVHFEYIPLLFDTIMYEFYIADRAQNLSNIEQTDTIIIEQD